MPDETTTIAPEAPQTTPEAPVQASTTPEVVQQPETTPEVTPQAPKPTIDQLLEGISLADMSDEQLADMQSGDPARIAAAIGAKAPETKPQAQTTPKGKETTPAAKPDDDGKLGRVSLKALKPESRTKFMEALQLVRDGKYDDIAPAIAEVFKLPVVAHAGEPPQNEPEQPTAPEVAPEIKAVEDMIAEKEAELAAAEAAYDYKGMATIQRELGRLDVDLRFAKVEAEKKAIQAQIEAEEDAKLQAAEDASRARALEKYGEAMSDPESGFADMVEVEIILAERKNDNILSQPDWPEKIANRVHEKYFSGGGIAKSAHSPQTLKIPAPPPQGSIRFPGSPVPGSAGTVAMTAQAAVPELEKLTPEERLAALQLAQQRAEQRRRY